MRLSLCSLPSHRLPSQDGLKAIDKATDEAVRQLLRNPPMKMVDDDVRSPLDTQLIHSLLESRCLRRCFVAALRPCAQRTDHS